MPSGERDCVHLASGELTSTYSQKGPPIRLYPLGGAKFKFPKRAARHLVLSPPERKIDSGHSESLVGLRHGALWA